MVIGTYNKNMQGHGLEYECGSDRNSSQMKREGGVITVLSNPIGKSFIDHYYFLLLIYKNFYFRNFEADAVSHFIKKNRCWYNIQHQT